MLFYLGLGAWVNGGTGEVQPQIYADGADQTENESTMSAMFGRKRAVIVLFTTVLISHSAVAAEPRCQALAGSNPQKLMQFLKDRQTAGPDPHCVEYALRS